jgi:DAK2 domain fusion protein YloV
MITVIAAMAHYLNQRTGENIINVLRKCLIYGRKTLWDTPKLLPVLARAGVIDSGALGFIVLIEGFLGGMTGEFPEEERESNYRFPPHVSDEGQKEYQVEFRYCTEALIHKKRSIPTRNIKIYLESQGDSIALVNDEEILKIHIHTNNPQELLVHLQTWGEVVTSKVEDMHDQIGLFEKDESYKDNAILALVPGPGFVDIFNTLGADHTLSYAETLPSPEEIAQKIKSISNDHIIILTNNKNIIPSASTAKSSVEKAVSILPTEDIVQGIAAMYGFSENDSPAENACNMTDCMDLVKSINIYKSERTVQFGNTHIEKNDYFVTHKDDIIAVSNHLNKVIMESFEMFTLKEMTNITIYGGDHSEKIDPSEILSYLKSVNDELELEVKYGGQNKNIAIISME